MTVRKSIFAEELAAIGVRINPQTGQVEHTTGTANGTGHNQHKKKSQGGPGPTGGSAVQQQRSTPRTRARWVKASEVDPVPPRWLWDKYLLLAQFNLLGGDPDVGKSYLTMKLVMHVTTGTPWPDGSPCPKGAAVLLCGEDSKDTIVSRLQLMGADCERVSILCGIEVSREDQDPALVRLSLTQALHVAEIEARVCQTGALLVIIDPIDTHLESTTQVKDGPAVRAYTNPLVDLAERTGAAVLAVAHLNKNTLTQALYRISGSIDLIAAARSALAVGRDPESDGGRRLLLPLKSNLSEKPAGRGFTISGAEGVVWDQQPVTTSAAAMLGGAGAAEAGPERTSKKQKAAGLLQLLLRAGPVRTLEIHKAMGDAGIGKRTVEAAKQELGAAVQAVKLGDHWYWRVRPGEAPSGDTCQDTSTSTDQGADGGDGGAAHVDEPPAPTPLRTCGVADLDETGVKDGEDGAVRAPIPAEGGPTGASKPRPQVRNTAQGVAGNERIWRCGGCKGTDFWQLPAAVGGDKRCIRCHPQTATRIKT